MSDIGKALTALRARILAGDGMAPQRLRRAAFDNHGLDDPLRTLADQVAMRSAGISDADIAAAKAAGYSEDQIYELAVCAAVGQATRQYDAAMKALADAAGGA